MVGVRGVVGNPQDIVDLSDCPLTVAQVDIADAEGAGVPADPREAPPEGDEVTVSVGNTDVQRAEGDNIVATPVEVAGVSAGRRCGSTACSRDSHDSGGDGSESQRGQESAGANCGGSGSGTVNRRHGVSSLVCQSWRPVAVAHRLR